MARPLRSAAELMVRRKEYLVSKNHEKVIKRLREDLINDTEQDPELREDARQSDNLVRLTFVEASIGGLRERDYKDIILKRPASWLGLIKRNIKNHGPLLSAELAKEMYLTHKKSFEPEYLAAGGADDESTPPSTALKRPSEVVSLLSESDELSIEPVELERGRALKVPKKTVMTAALPPKKRSRSRSADEKASRKQQRRHHQRATPRNRISYKNAIWKVFKTMSWPARSGKDQTPPPKSISQKAMQELDDLVHVLADRICSTASSLMRKEKRYTLMAEDIKSATRLLCDFELGKHALSEGTKALTRYYINSGNPEARERKRVSPGSVAE
jgi:histone H2B